MLHFHQEPIIEEIKDPLLDKKRVQLFIKREDLIHPYVSGNKWRKLKYNLVRAKELGYSTLLTFGGAFSNHIYATAAAASETEFNSVGIIRGEELASKPLNRTLQFASDKGMVLKYVTRGDYRIKENRAFIEKLEEEFGAFYLIPEGGTNDLAIKGCEEIMTPEVEEFDIVSASVGTGGTISGIIAGSKPHQNIFGVSALKGGFLTEQVAHLLSGYSQKRFINWEINDQYHFGGYAKTTSELAHFIKAFEEQHKIPLDQVYTGKMMYGIFDMIQNDKFETGAKILAIHTGGLQGRNVIEPI